MAARGHLAADWAAAQVNLCSASDQDAALFHDWVGHGGWWNGDWSGYCTRFVWTAWRRAGVDIWAAKHATQVWVRFASVAQTGPAPSGAILFWPDFTAAGHIAIADGRGAAYTTTGGDGAHTPVAHTAIADRTRVCRLGAAAVAWPCLARRSNRPEPPRL
jgi:hypothetical protein